MNIYQYYNHPTIRRITREFCGEVPYFLGSGKYLQDLGWEMPVKVINTPDRNEFWNAYNELTAMGLDLYRPLRDSDDQYLLALLDLEYFNIEGYRELYEQQLSIFFELEAFFCHLKEIFEEHYKIPVIIDTTASGYHLLTKIPADSQAFTELAELGKGALHQELLDKYAATDPDDFKRSSPTPENFAYAYYGLGKVMQYIAFQLITHKKSRLPVTVGDVATGHDMYSKQGISIDLSQYCDPYYMRVIRTAASTHQKHLMKHFANRPPAIDVIRTKNLFPQKLLEIMWDYDKAIHHYQKIDAQIPVSESGWKQLIADYKQSIAALLHEKFELPPQEFAIDSLRQAVPPCIAQIIDSPFPNALKPTNMKFISQVLLKKGMNIHQIKYLMETLYMSIQGWESPHKYDRRSKADYWMSFYTSETLLDLNNEPVSCEMHKRKGYGFCPLKHNVFCNENLRTYCERPF